MPASMLNGITICLPKMEVKQSVLNRRTIYLPKIKESRSKFINGVSLICLLVFVGYPCWGVAQTSDIDALNSFRAKADPGHVLDGKWVNGTDVCTWEGVKECIDGRVTKLSLQYSRLNGTFADGSLSQLSELRVLSLKGNGLTGTVPDLCGLTNLKILFLDHNRFTGPFPESLTTLRRLVVVVLSFNQFSGAIPRTLTRVQKLYIFRAENNNFTGEIPALNQSSLRFFNVSNNRLYGDIPATVALASFNASSFSGNPMLCGGPLPRAACASTVAPAYPANLFHPGLAPSTVIVGNGGSKMSKKEVIGIVVGSVLGSVVGLSAILLCVFFFFLNRARKSWATDDAPSAKGGADHRGGRPPEEEKNEGGPVLVFCGGGGVQMYTLEDLLRASAEILGRGSVGITYRAVMQWGLMVTVKRLKNGPKGCKAFEKQMDAIGKLKHPNLISLRAYFHANEERLVVYDYQPNGSLFAFIHGSGDSWDGKPLHWTSCVKIAKEVANGLVYLHAASLAHNFHGNLHPANILLGREMEVCLTDFGLTPFQDDDEGEGGRSDSFVAYRAPEWKSLKKRTPASGPKADVYSFGILVLELLTGRTPSPSFIHGGSSETDHVHEWVRSVREQEMEGGAAEDDSSTDKLVVLLNVAVSCVALSPDERPTIEEVLTVLEEDAIESHSYPEDFHGSSIPTEEQGMGDNTSERSWSEPE